MQCCRGGLLKYDLDTDVQLRLEMKTHFYTKFCRKNETHFYTRATNFKQNLLKMSHYFPKFLKLSSKFQEFWYQIDEIGHIFVPI